MSDEQTLIVIWVVLGGALLAAEMFTVTFIALYFGIGALAAALSGYLGLELVWQLVVFALVSFALLLLTRPWLMAKLQTPHIPSNAQTIVGRRGVVTINIDNDRSTGQIRIGTEYWTARTEDTDPQVIAAGAKVEVISVAGVTARVRPVAADAATDSATAT